MEFDWNFNSKGLIEREKLGQREKEREILSFESLDITFYFSRNPRENLRSRSFPFDPFFAYEKGQARENKFVRSETKIFPDRTIFDDFRFLNIHEIAARELIVLKRPRNFDEMLFHLASGSTISAPPHGARKRRSSASRSFLGRS